MPRGPNRDWTRKAIRDGNTIIGHIHYTPSNQGAYQTLKTEANAPRVNRFGSRQVLRGDGTIKTAYASGKLRRRNANAARLALAGVNTLNPHYNPPNTHKAHLVSDAFGGPSVPNNLANERRAVNLSGHKRIDNRIDRFMTAVAGGNNHYATNRGGMVVKESYRHASGAPKGRLYMVSVKNQATGAKTYHKFTFKPL
ncbi:hypothetical protein [Dyella sp. 2RAB6]|uniref:hypothetical protein n=1 Tax=Dyella sp. 2RAB6 TaxID=3232992 RepID=UPI003F900AA2